MAQKVHVLLIDDMDGGDADETVQFGLEGTTYEIDLSHRNADRLRDALSKWVEKGRKLKSHSAPSYTAPKSLKRTQLPDAKPGWNMQERRWIQRWAAENGMKPPADRGIIAAKVGQAWEAAGRPKA